MFYIFPRAVRPDVCDDIVKNCKQNILEEASVYNYDKTSSKDDPEIRKTSIHFIKDKNNRVNELAWKFLREANKIQFNYDLTYFQAIQFAEYKDGGFYGWHQDASGIDQNNETRKLSLSIILSDPTTFEGGELQFYNGGKPMQNMGKITGEQVINDINSQGTAIVFDSRDWHRVTPVVKGIRHSIVCWTVGPNFK
jgi:PKHD-type hydroxylase|tara:strand:- start:368 stop:952 length:585 start_codon:yes stop_codon:yes gene_type:complete